MHPLRIVAIVLVLVGAVWIGQGLSLVKGSAMTGSSFWAIAGLVLLVVGGAILIRETRPSARS